MAAIKYIKNKQAMLQFIDLPNQLYKDDQNYVPAPYSFSKHLFSKTKNPFFRHADAAFLMAYQGNTPVGRIVAIKNNLHLRQANDQTGFFGFFECIEDYNVAAKLLDHASNWLRSKGLSKIIGPENYSTNESCGFQLNNSARPPVAFMPYNKPYYPSYVEKYGFTKILDLRSYSIPKASYNRLPDKIVERLTRKHNDMGIVFRPIKFTQFKKEIYNLRHAYNQAFKDNWGFVPINEDEFEIFARDIKRISSEDMILLAIRNEVIIGFMVAVFDINQLFIHIKRGKIFPYGLFPLLRYRNRIDQARLLILGVKPEYRNLGIDARFYNQMFQNLKDKGVQLAEAAYVMENNYVMQGIINKIGGIESNTYRLYQKKI